MQNKGISVPAVIIAVLIPVIFIGGIIYLRSVNISKEGVEAPAKETENTTANSENREGLSECKIYEKDFGVLKFDKMNHTKTKLFPTGSEVEGDIGVYNNSSFRLANFACKTEQECRELVAETINYFKQSESFKSGQLIAEEKQYNGGNYTRFTKATEGTRYFWAGENSLMAVIAETSSDNITKTAGLSDALNQLLNFYLSVCPPIK
jgi:hypothetical protein